MHRVKIKPFKNFYKTEGIIYIHFTIKKDNLESIKRNT